MPKLAYLDCPTGIAGDMFLGALVDAGVPIDYQKLPMPKLSLDDRGWLNGTIEMLP